MIKAGSQLKKVVAVNAATTILRKQQKAGTPPPWTEAPLAIATSGQRRPSAPSTSALPES
jgi:hypothetical protein